MSLEADEKYVAFRGSTSNKFVVSTPCKAVAGKHVAMQAKGKYIFLSGECRGEEPETNRRYLGKSLGYFQGTEIVGIKCIQCPETYIEIHVTGCGQPLPDVAVSVVNDEDEDIIIEGVSDANGVIRIDFEELGTYTITYTDIPDRYQTPSAQTIGIVGYGNQGKYRYPVPSGSVLNGPLVVSLQPENDYACRCNCAVPIKKTLYVNTDFGEATIVYSGIFGHWTGEGVLTLDAITSYASCLDGSRVYRCIKSAPVSSNVTVVFDFDGCKLRAHLKKYPDVFDPFFQCTGFPSLMYSMYPTADAFSADAPYCNAPGNASPTLFAISPTTNQECGTGPWEGTVGHLDVSGRIPFQADYVLSE